MLKIQQQKVIDRKLIFIQIRGSRQVFKKIVKDAMIRKDEL